MKQLYKILRIAVLASVCALSGLPQDSLAQRDPSAASGMPMPPRMPLLTMDQKVGRANHIFVGVGKRVYFVDAEYKEVPYEHAGRLPQSLTRFALLEIEVEKTLYSKTELAPKIALRFASVSREPFGDPPSSYELLVSRHTGRRGIYFGQMQTDQIRVDMPDGPSKVIGQVTLHQFIVYDAIEGPTANPLPLSYLPETTAAVERRVEREKREAVEAAAKKSPNP